MQRRQTTGDTLPAELSSRTGSLERINPVTVRRADEFDGVEHWISGGSVALCLHALPDQSACQAAEDSFNRGAILFDPDPAGVGGLTRDSWTTNLAGIIEDGFDTATVGTVSTPVRSNVFVFAGRPPGDRLILSGPAGTREVSLRRSTG